MSTSQIILELLEARRGDRPDSLLDPATEDVLQIALALLVEHAAAIDRIDQLEQRLNALMAANAVDPPDPDNASVAEASGDALNALLIRVLRPLL